MAVIRYFNVTHMIKHGWKNSGKVLLRCFYFYLLCWKKKKNDCWRKTASCRLLRVIVKSLWRTWRGRILLKCGKIYFVIRSSANWHMTSKIFNIIGNKQQHILAKAKYRNNTFQGRVVGNTVKNDLASGVLGWGGGGEDPTKIIFMSQGRKKHMARPTEGLSQTVRVLGPLSYRATRSTCDNFPLLN